MSESLAGNGSHTSAPRRRSDRWNPLKEDGPGRPWAEDAKSNIGFLRTRLAAIKDRPAPKDRHSNWPVATTGAAHRSCLNGVAEMNRESLVEHITTTLDKAEAAATGVSPRYVPVLSAWNGACVESAYKNIHYAEASLARLFNADEVAHAAPDALRRVKGALALDDPTRREAFGLWQDVTKPHCPCMAGKLSEIIAVGHEAADRSRARLQMFRNTLIAGTAVASALLALLVLYAWLNPTFIPLCFTAASPPPPPGFAVVCPTRGSVGGALPVEPSPPDVLTVALLGLVGGALSALVFIRGLYGNATPYNVAVPLAVLKIPAGALTAVTGMILVAGDFVPGLSTVDKPAQIIAYALVFGFAQQLATKMLDQRAQKLISNIPSKERRDDMPMAMTA